MAVAASRRGRCQERVRTDLLRHCHRQVDRAGAITGGEHGGGHYVYMQRAQHPDQPGQPTRTVRDVDAQPPRCAGLVLGYKKQFCRRERCTDPSH